MALRAWPRAGSAPREWTYRAAPDAASAPWPGREERRVAVQQFMTLPEIRRPAQRTLRRDGWDYTSGGSETETALRRNARAMRHYVFRPRVLRGVSQIDTTTTFLGLPLAFP